MANRKKYQSIAVTFFFRGDIHTVAVAFKNQGASGVAEAIAGIIQEVVLDVVGFSVGDCIESFVQDAAALKVASMFDAEVAANPFRFDARMPSSICLLHNMTKPGQYMGSKAHSRNKVKYDFSKVAETTQARVLAICNHFAYGSRSKMLQAICEKLNLPQRVVERAINGTRLTSVQGAFTSTLSIATAIKQYVDPPPPPRCQH